MLFLQLYISVAKTMKHTEPELLCLNVPLLFCKVIIKQPMLSDNCQEYTHTLEEKQRQHLFDLKTQTLPYPCFSCTHSIQKLVKLEHFMSILKNAQT